jgi:hypothetical protein
MADSFIRVPADSTGKRIRHNQMVDLKMTSVSIDLNSVDEDTVITGLSSGVSAKFKGFTVEEGTTFIYVTSPSGDFTAGEDLQINASTFGVLNTALELYTSINHIADHDTPENTWTIDDKGAGFVRFEEGTVTFDAFGYAQVSELSVMRADTFLYGDTNPALYSDTTIGAGAITGSVATSQLRLSVDNVSGSRAVRTSNLYFPYAPGEGNFSIFTVVVGDSGKSGCIRRWGMFDDEDGLYFQLSGSEFGVGIRTSVPGGTDQYVAQSDFNGTSLQTTGIDPYILDVSKYQIYWMDYQWLGVGQVRFGAWTPAGERIVMHTFKHANTLTVPYMKRGTLPWRAEIDNIGGTSGISDMSMNCAAVLRQSGELELKGTNFLQTSAGDTVAVSGSDWVPLISLRPKTTVNGVTNRNQIIPEELQAFVEGDAIEFRGFANAGLTGSAFSIEQGSLDLDTSATSMNGGITRNALLVGSGVTQIPLSDGTLDYAVQLRADGVQPVVTLAAKCIKASGTANVKYLAKWTEIK